MNRDPMIMGVIIVRRTINRIALSLFVFRIKIYVANMHVAIQLVIINGSSMCVYTLFHRMGMSSTSR